MKIVVLRRGIPRRLPSVSRPALIQEDSRCVFLSQLGFSMHPVWMEWQHEHGWRSLWMRVNLEDA